MRNLSIAAAIALFTLAGPGDAAAQINQCNNNGNAAAGTVVGAIVGGTTGGLIAGNRRGFRGNNFRGFRGRGFRGGRRGNAGLGIALGALAGGIVGNQVATARTQNCFRQKQAFAQNQSRFQNSPDLAGGPIDYNARRLGDPYGGRTIVGQSSVATSSTTGTQPISTGQQGQSSGVFQPVCQNVNRETRLPDGRIINEPVEYCQFSPGGEWILR